METVFENMERAHSSIPREKIKDDLRVLVRDAEALLKATAGDMSDKAQQARSRLGEALDNAKVTCHRLEEKTMATAKATDRVIRDHPYESLGVAFGFGLLMGVLLLPRGRMRL